MRKIAKEKVVLSRKLQFTCRLWESINATLPRVSIDSAKSIVMLFKVSAVDFFLIRRDI